MTMVWTGNESMRKLLAPVDGLHTHPKNPRKGNVEVIRSSLTRFGQQRPILALPDGTIVAGNHTYRAAVAEGWTHIAVVRSDLPEAEIEAYLLADNRTSDLGTYDDSQLAALLKPYYEQDALLGTGYDSGLVERLLRADEKARGSADDVPPVPPEPRSKIGELYVMGPHRLVCGDAADQEAYEILLDGEMADAVWTDPPYGVSYVGQTADALTIMNDALPIAQFTLFLKHTLGAALTQSRPGSNWYVAAPSSSGGADAFPEVLTVLGLRRHTLVWVKDTLVLSRGDFHYRHEFIYYGWKAGGKRVRPTDRTLTTVLEFPRPHVSAEHPTMKPVALIEHCLRASTRKGNLVLDPFGGSGSTLIACEQLGRRAALIELDPRYCDVIRQRYADHVGDQAFAP